jgi:hypothetical protein
MKLALVFLLAIVAACTPAWWRTTLPQDVSAFEARVNTYVATADALFDQAAPFLGDQGPIWSKRLADAKLALTSAEDALDQVVRAAQASQGDAPDVATLINSALKAADDVLAVIDGVKSIAANSPPHGMAPPPLDVSALHAQREHLR